MVTRRRFPDRLETPPEGAEEPCRVELERRDAGSRTQPLGYGRPETKRLAAHRGHEACSLARIAAHAHGVVGTHIETRGRKPPLVDDRSGRVRNAPVRNADRLAQSAGSQLIPYGKDLLIQPLQTARKQIVELT